MIAVVKKILNGKMNTDDDISSVNPVYPQGDYLDSENTRFSSITGENNTRVSVLGNTEVVNPYLPEGENYTVGRFEDSGYLYVFNWNSENLDGIYRYNAVQDEWQELVIGDFGFDKTQKVHSVGIMNDILYWTDAKYVTSIEGNGLRCVNVKKAVNRKRVYDIVFEPDQVLAATLTFVAITLTSPDGVAETGFFYPVGATYKEWLQSLADGLNTVFATIEFTACETNLKAAIVAEGKYTIDAVGLAYTGATVATLEVIAYAENFYPEPTVIEHIDRAKYSPLCEPMLTYGTDLTRKQNYVYDKYFQFAVQYEYDNSEISPISPVSRLAFGEMPCGISFDEYSNNYIRVDFTDTRLNSASSLAILKRVNLLVRFGYNREWRLVKTLDRYDFNISKNYFDFYNDGSYPTWSFSEYRQNIPLKALSQEFVGNRGYIAGTKEGEDNLDCIDVGTELSYEDSCEPKQFGTVYAKIKIRNAQYLTQGQVIWDNGGTTVYGGIVTAFVPVINPEDVQQEIPLAGFLMYAAGTPYAAISRQINPGGALPTIAGDENIFDVSTVTNAGLVRAAVIADTVYSEVSLSLPPGRHILRMASPQIGPDKTGLYQYPGGGYQRTSCYLKGFPSNSETAFSNTCEIIVDVVEGVTTDIGTIEVYDLTEHAVFHGYCLDSEGLFDAEDVIDGATVEMMSVTDATVNPEIRCFGNKGVTDHNGYFFLAKQSPILANYNPIFGAGAFRTTGQNYFENSLNYLFINESGTVATSSAVAIGDGLPVVVYSIVSPAAFSENYRTIIEGEILDEDGNPVSGMTVLCGLTGRVFSSDGDGKYNALVYLDMLLGSAPTKRVAYVLQRPSAACCIEYLEPLAGEPYSINNVIGIGTTYTFTNHFFANDFVIALDGLAVEMLWKHRNIVELGIVYLDVAGRRTMVQESSNFVVEIPAITDEGGNEGKPLIQYSINHEPPESAVKYMIVRKLNPYYNRYLQFIIGDVEYVSFYDAAAEPPEPVTTSFGAGDAKEIYMSLIPVLNYQQENTGSILGYIPEPGDRVLFLKDDAGNTYEAYYDFEVNKRGEGTVLSPLQLIIKNNSSLPELQPGTFIEVYTPKKVLEEDFYFEFGQCHDITDGFHMAGNGGQNQTLTQPATGYLYGGDTFVRTREMFYLDGVEKNYFVRKCEDEYISDTDINSNQLSIGHPNIADANQNQFDHFTRIRVSDVITSTGNKLYNGLSSFEFSLYKDADRNWGPIHKLVRVGEKHELLAIQARKIQPIYVGQIPVESLADGNRTIITDTLINLFQPFKSPYGTQNPESVVQEGNFVWAYDRERALFWFYALNDPANISEELGVKILVQQITAELEDFDANRIFVIGGLDRRNREVVWAFQEVPAVIDGPGTGEGEDTGDGGGGGFETGRTTSELSDELVFSPKTLAWSYKRNEWETRYTYYPEAIWSIGEQRFYAMKSGKLYLQDSGDACTFFGVKSPARITAVIATEPNIVKDWYGGRIKSYGAWAMSEIRIPANNTFKLGMRSRLTANNYSLDEGDYWFSFLADMSDPGFDEELEALYEGRSLKGGVMVITFENNDTTQASLEEIAIKISASMETM